jgi:hypothetical protein
MKFTDNFDRLHKQDTEYRRKRTQKERILGELLVNENVTSWELIERCQVTNPTGRIDELRKDGHKIENIRVERNGRSLTAFRLER